MTDHPPPIGSFQKIHRLGLLRLFLRSLGVIPVKENDSIVVKRDKPLGLTMSPISIWFSTNDEKIIAYSDYCKVYFDVYFTKKKKGRHNIVNNNEKIYKLCPVTLPIILLYMFPFVNSAGFLVSILALLLVVRRMFSHHVSLEARRCGALVNTVVTGKRLLISVRSRVLL